MKYDINNTKKFIEQFTREDGLLELGKYNHDALAEAVVQDRQEAYEAGRQSIIADTENVINNEIIIHKQLESECVGSIENIKSGRKGENPHTFVIEQLQVLKSQIINKLKG
jgi:hypothetical protein